MMGLRKRLAMFFALNILVQRKQFLLLRHILKLWKQKERPSSDRAASFSPQNKDSYNP